MRKGKIALAYPLDNLCLSASVSSNALTVSLKGANGSDPSATNIVTMAFDLPR